MLAVSATCIPSQLICGHLNSLSSLTSSLQSSPLHSFGLSVSNNRKSGVNKSSLENRHSRESWCMIRQISQTFQRIFKKSSTMVTAMTSTSIFKFEDSFTSLQSLQEILASSGHGRNSELILAKTNERLFGNEKEPRIIFYRDNSSWCPYCERVWLQLEEKQIPYRVEKINMRCYGPKPAWYTQMVPSGLLPAVKIDGKLITESLDIMFAIEQVFTDYKSLLPPRNSKDFNELNAMLRLERKFMGAWLQLITSPWGNKGAFEKVLVEVDTLLEQRGGPYFLGKEFSLVDAIYAPFLERAAASVPYWKGLVIRGTGKWPSLDKWFDAMDSRPIYKAMKSDDFTITHCLEPQIGQCYFSPESTAYHNMVEGKDGSWDLPLKPETTAWGFDDGAGGNGAKEQAAKSLIENHDAVVGFALRGVSGGEEYRGAVSVGFRAVAEALLKGVDATTRLPDNLPKQVAVAAAYLRDRVGVPRDMSYPAARQLRAHLNWLIKQLGSDL